MGYSGPDAHFIPEDLEKLGKDIGANPAFDACFVV
jgi:hypothetical protein